MRAHSRFVRITTILLAATAATVMAAGPGHAAGPTEEWLFVAQAPTARTAPMAATAQRDERFRLTLRAPAPITKFSDRPFRDAHLISPTALVTHWNGWFADSPPNAVLTFPQADGAAPASIVVALTRPAWNATTRELSFTAMRERVQHDPALKGANWTRPVTPRTMSDVSVFIDDAEDCDLNAVPIDCPGAELAGASLIRRNLAGANLAGSDLFGSDLFEADLTGARLAGAVLAGADLTLANLAGADLSGANLTGADLSGANLTRANLALANLQSADLTGADLTGATLTGARPTSREPDAAVWDQTTVCPDGTRGPCVL